MPTTTIAIHVNGRERVINTLEDWKAITWFVEASFATEGQSAQTEKPQASSAQRILPLQPAPGERMVDYAVKAAKALPPTFTIRELINQMVAMGWKTRSKDMESMLSSVRTITSRSPLFKKLGDGTWRFQGDLHGG